MDILSHGLWAAAAVKKINQKKSINLKLIWATFWGMFPDLFAFAPAFVWIFYLRFKGINIIPIRPENAESLEQTGGGPFILSHTLYNYSHSLFVLLGVVAGIVLIKYLLKKKITWRDLPLVMLGWPLHILCDIPTHSYEFYPTPFLWPFSNWKFDGFSWGQWWFVLFNYGALLMVYILLKKSELKKSP